LNQLLSLSKSVDNLPIIFLIALTLVSVFVFSGYHFYSSDQSTQLPAVLHFFDNELYQKDFDMQIINPPAVKMLPHLMLFIVSKITFVPISYIYFFAFTAITFFIFYFVYKISFELTAKKHIGLLACLLLLLARNFPTLSNFSVITTALVPYFIAVPIALLCLYLMLKKRYLLSFTVCSLLFYVHGQISFFVFLAMLPGLFLQKNFKLLKKSILVYVLIILPALLSLILTFTPFSQPIPQYSITELIMFNVPFHFFPKIEEILAYFVFAFFVIVLLITTKSKKEFCYWNYVLLAIIALGLIFTILAPIEFVLFLYLIRVDVFLTISFVILLSIALFNLITGIKFTVSKNSIEFSELCRLLLFSLAVFFALGLFSVPDFNQPGIEPRANNFTDIANYARLNTPKNSLFLTPPYLRGFRLYSERSVVVEAKTNPVGRGSVIQDEWFNRLLALCNVIEFKSSALFIGRECNFDSLSREKYLSLCKDYNADYFVTRNTGGVSQWSDLLVYNNSSFALFNCFPI